MSGDAAQQAQQFLESIFGEKNTYNVFDGDYGEWMNIAVDDDDVHELHIEIQSIEPLILYIIRVEFTLPDDLEDVDVPDPLYNKKQVKILDFGTGTSCLLITLVLELKKKVIGVGVDNSVEAPDIMNHR